MTVGVALGGRNLNLTPDEKRVFGQLFKAADPENVGVVTGEVAAKLFQKSGLDPLVLGKVSI
jgi:epidermal growth factor receptor substrate 15